MIYDGFDSGMDAQGALRSKWLANIKDSNHDFGMKDGKTVVWLCMVPFWCHMSY